MYNGAIPYEIVSSENLPFGELRIFFYPTSDDHMTYCYFPYTFNVENNGYRDPNAPNVPSLMMTKRHTFEEFVPVQAVIRILNNTGYSPDRSEPRAISIV